MSCTFDRERISLYVSDDLTLPERRVVEAHLAGCAECRKLVAQYREGAAALAGSLKGATVPIQRPDTAPRSVGWAWVPAAAAVLLVMVAAVPQARAEVARLFGWHSIQVDQPGRESEEGKVEPGQNATVRYDREMTQVDTEPTARQFTTSLAEAREFLGNGVALPPELEGQEMLLYRVEDKEGKLVMVGLSEPNTGFWARYRADGKLERINATYGDAFDVTTEESSIGGRPAKIVTATQKSGKASVDIWIQDGKWVYEIHGYGRDLPKLMKMAESME